jgi:hypothetical protein
MCSHKEWLPCPLESNRRGCSFDEVDRDASGAIDFRELRALMATCAGGVEPSDDEIGAIFAEVSGRIMTCEDPGTDRDSGGVASGIGVDLVSSQRRVTLVWCGCCCVVAEADENHDGTIDFAEFCTIFARARAPGGFRGCSPRLLAAVDAVDALGVRSVARDSEAGRLALKTRRLALARGGGTLILAGPGGYGKVVTRGVRACI